MDLKARIEAAIEDGFTRIQEVQDQNAHFKTEWQAKEREIFDTFKEAEGWLQEKLGKASANWPKGSGGFHPVRLDVTVLPSKLPGPRNDTDQEKTYSLSFRPDSKARTFVCEVSPGSLLGDLPRRYEPQKLDRGDVEDSVELFAKGIMSRLASSAVK